MSIEKLLDALKSRSIYARIDAARKLAELADPSLKDIYLSLLDDESAKVRYYAVKALMNINARDVYENIQARLEKEKDSYTQTAMAEYLIMLSDNPKVISILKIPLHRDAKLHALDLLLNKFSFTEISDPKLYSIVRDLAIKDPDRKVRAKAILLLSIFSKHFENELLWIIRDIFSKELDIGIRESAAYLLSTISKEKSRQWIKHFLSTETQPTVIIELLKGIKRLGIVGDKEIEATIHKIIHSFSDVVGRDPYRTIYYECMAILTQSNYQAAKDLLHKHATAENKDLRLHALKNMILLDEITRDSAAKYLLTERDKDIKIEIIKLFGRLRVQTVVDDLIKLLEDKDPEVQSAVADALAEINGDVVVAAMRDILATKRDKELRKLADRVLRRVIKGEEVKVPVSEEMQEEVISEPFLLEGISKAIERPVFSTKSFPIYLILVGGLILGLIYSPINQIILDRFIVPHVVSLVYLVTLAKFISGFSIVYMITSKIRTATRILDKISKKHTFWLSKALLSMIDLFVVVYMFTSFQDLIKLFASGYALRVVPLRTAVDFAAYLLLSSVMEAFGFLFFTYYIFRYGLKSLTKSAWTKDILMEIVPTHVRIIRYSYLLIGIVVSYLLALLSLVGKVPLVTLGMDLGILIGGSLFILYKRGVKFILLIWIIMIGIVAVL